MEVLGIFTALAVLSWYWLSGLVILFIVLSLAAYKESLIVSLFSLTGLLLIAYFSGVVDFSAISFLDIVIYGVGYIIIGLIWSLFKYKMEVKSIVERTRKRHTIVEGPLKGSGPLGDSSKITLELLKERIKENIEYNIPKDRISLWVVFFPYSIIKFVFGDFIEYIISKMGKIYQKIQDHVINSELKNKKIN